MSDEEIRKLISESQLLTAFFCGRGLTTEEAKNVLLFSLTVYLLTGTNLEVDVNKVSHLITNICDTVISTLKTYSGESN